MSIKTMLSGQTEQFGRYQVLAEIGRGAMGVVYLARDPRIDRQVAIKTVPLLNQGPEHEHEFRERFFLEARAAGRLSHPGIVTIFDVGEDPETRSPFIVMEYVAGESLQALLARTQKLPLATALQVARELSEALDYAHAQRVIHRDIKPANIMMTEDGRAKITDFGIAKLNLANFTIAGNALGTPAFMAPEQLEGERVDGRADLFSVGVVLYTMLTGHRPFQGNSAATVSFKVVNKDPVPPTAFDADFPVELDYVISRAIAKAPAQRYQRGREMALDLKNLSQGYLPRGLTHHAEARSERSSQSFALHAIHDAVPSVLQKATEAKLGDIRRSLTSHQFGRSFVWKSAVALAICLLAGIVILSSLRSGASGAGRDVAEHNSSRSTNARSGKTFAAQPDSLPTAAFSTTDRTDRSGADTESHLKIKIEHHFTQARFLIWVDHRLAYHHELEGEVKKHLILFHEIRGSESASLHLPAGKHVIKIEVSSRNGYRQARTISADFASQSTKFLHVKCSGRQEMSVSLQ